MGFMDLLSQGCTQQQNAHAGYEGKHFSTKNDLVNGKINPWVSNPNSTTIQWIHIGKNDPYKSPSHIFELRNINGIHVAKTIPTTPRNRGSFIPFVVQLKKWVFAAE